MSEVKIYTVVSDELSPPVIGESFCTDMVRHSDYSALEQKLTDMAVQLANAESKCRELAAENAALKAFSVKLGDMHNDLNGEGAGIQGRAEVACQQVALEAAMDEFDAIKTPATDAFLAEVRASGVEMFGQYHNFSEKLFIQKESKKFATQLRKGASL
ncbi:hypothetical protein [Citrobacter freundii]|uniref:hypothetical protein n=1 Tax=Citrobacter freundii TaxID=546 RepID=UPI00155DEE18|nr:hypothetical protein [Citrobacter freundii]